MLVIICYIGIYSFIRVWTEVI